MKRFQWWKALPVTWARIALSSAAFTIACSGLVKALVKLADADPNFTFGEIVALLIASIAPGLALLMVGTAIAAPVAIAALLHYVTRWILHGLHSRWQRPLWLESLWEGCLCWMATVLAMTACVLFIAPFAAANVPEEAGGFVILMAGFLGLAIQHGVLLLEYWVRRAVPVAVPAAAGPQPISQAETAAVEADLRRQKARVRGQQRQAEIDPFNSRNLKL